MKWEKVRKALLVSVCALQIGLVGSIANAEEQSAASDVTITAFSLLEKKFDKTGSAEFKPDGSRDGHFQASIHFAQKTVVNAVILRSTDVFGKENYHGIWRTNRVGVGWLLGIVQGEKVITPAFRPSPKDPVGTFEGDVTFDLYANDNGDIEEGQYFVLEIETPNDTIYSEPITFGEPMNGGAGGGTGGGTTTDPNPNPTPNPTPNPVPNPVPVTELTIKGGQGVISVQGATPGAMITLFHKSSSSYGVTWIENYGTKNADSKGSTSFAKLPSGEQFYVIETVNGQKSRTSGDASVTDEKTADLLKTDSIGAYYLVVKGKPITQVELGVYGSVTDTSIKTVDVSFAGVSTSVPVDGKGRYNLKRIYDIYSPMDIVSVTAVSNGKKHVIHRKLGFDLFDDTSVKAEREGNHLKISANKGTIQSGDFQVFILDGNKLVPIPGEIGRLEGNTWTALNFKGVLATDKAPQDIRLFVLFDTLAEVVPIMP
ncbi:hypothetical protein [Brevibacillus migulae]|uniref:hypothetical protein n=1 Tax=Brevibacillus migulae TaxID=1644114 RepID=UPI00106ECCEB|nr:hypothetical protein [Brevibacillus migulae]